MIFSKTYLSRLLIVLFHIIGCLGLSFNETRPFFLGLVPFHILLMSGILFANFAKAPNKTIYAAIIVFVAGYIIEVIGVKTGVIFGKYYYGNTLGFKVLSVPLIIGLNWFVVIFSVGGVLRSLLKSSKVLRTIIGAFILVGLDYLIEPVAVKFDYWSWENNIIPFQNYVGWFFVSLVMMAFYNYYDFKKTNTVYKTLFYAQLLFFIALNIFIK
ncbi:MAG: carotenoid biosynthesis protein [Sphingobacteriales bacterium]|nr:MAG: carotenoid biosynthesis protein [Sphingobacteriales bacterium]